MSPFKPVEKLVKWVEFAAEFSELNELNLPMEELNFFVYYCLDVILAGCANVIAILAFVFHATAQKVVIIHHPNTKIIYQFIFVMAFLIAVHLMVFYILELWRLSYPFVNPCNRLWWTPLLFYLRSSYSVFVTGMNSSMIVLCIERIVCNCRISSYEQSSKPTAIALTLTIMAILFSVVFVLVYSPGIEWSKGLAISTVRNANNADYFQMTICFLMAMECIGLFFFLFIHNWSLWYRRKFRGFHQTKSSVLSFNCLLSIKFQIEETLKMTKLFLPLVIVKCFMMLFSILSQIFVYQVWPKGFSVGIQMIIYEGVNMQYLQSLPTAFFLIYGSGQLRRFFPTKRNYVTPTESTLQSQDEHFRRLKNLFEK
uniref:Uncharacterized protein n=1 Tax=Ditylenchus dipsaci TaxID=166011 RepID=A0A915EH70_9BILA